MRKFLLPGILAVFSLFLPLRSQAVPLDVPYQILVSTEIGNVSQLIISTNNFPSGSALVNSNVLNYQWCITNAVVSSPSAGLFTMAWSTSTLTPANTDYAVATVANTALQANFNYRTPYCAPEGEPVLTIRTGVAGSTITASGYLWKGWNP
jgi:hypothetical protein